MMFGKKKIKFIKQIDSNDCGLACLAMISGHFGNKMGISDLKSFVQTSAQGISIENLISAGREIGIELIPLHISASQLKSDLPYPAIVYWNQNHFLIVEGIKSGTVQLVDPAIGRIKIPLSEFHDGWLIPNQLGKTSIQEKKGVLFLIQPTEIFGDQVIEKKKKSRNYRGFIKENFLNYPGDNFRIFLSLLVISSIQLILPFANQLIVDYGIKYDNYSLILNIGITVSVLYLLIAVNEFLRSWSLIYLGSKINYKLISRFLMKISSLPIRTIYSKKIGDYIERINDHKKIENFFSESIVNSLFSIVSLIIYSVLLAFFSYKIFFVVLSITLLELFWIFRFIGSIKTIDNRLFSINAQDQEKVYEILSNLHDIKLNNLEAAKNNEWKTIQKKLFRINLQKLKLGQMEKGGSKIFSSVQFVLVTVISALSVSSGEYSLGTMLSIIFIVNQLNYPITHLINFILQFQVVENSFERILEIQGLQEEDAGGIVPEDLASKDIRFNNVSFSYNSSAMVLKDISCIIPSGSTTAIVGYSGSGKTTLLKLLLKFYDNYEGEILIGPENTEINRIKSSSWRNSCGAVLQENSIYSESIAYNIALLPVEEIDGERLAQAIRLACLEEFVNNLPLGVFSKLNSTSIAMSSGQKQRLFIARLIYKNAPFIFLDEATNSLDAHTESVILENMNGFLKNKTTVVVAHRLSTVKNADQIIVMEHGRISEVGSHEQLIANQSTYFNLIKNQLELENERY